MDDKKKISQTFKRIKPATWSGKMELQSNNFV